MVAEAGCFAAPEKKPAVEDLSLSVSVHDSGEIMPVPEAFASDVFCADATNDDLLFSGERCLF